MSRPRTCHIEDSWSATYRSRAWRLRHRDVDGQHGDGQSLTRLHVHRQEGLEVDLHVELGKSLAIHHEQLGLSLTFTLALLDPGAWKALTGGAVSYGLPFVDDWGMVLPSRQEGAIVTAYTAHASSPPTNVMNLVQMSRRPFRCCKDLKAAR